MAKPDGGPAFARPYSQTGASSQEGMSLRDYFAGQALLTIRGLWDSTEEAARAAYALADAMLAERDKE